MLSAVHRYTRWLHTGWPAGTVEKLPEVRDDGSTNAEGIYVVGDLAGIPLLKFSADTGARAVQTIASDPAFARARGEGGEQVLDLAIVGGGVSGMAAALEAKAQGLSFELFEAAEPFSTVVNFPKGKPIFTYPTEMIPTGDLQFKAKIKEQLVEELEAQTLGRGIEPTLLRVERIGRQGRLLEVVIPAGENRLARRVIVAIGRSGNFRKLGVPGEDRDKVTNRLHDPMSYSGQGVLVVGGGDSAIEAAIALAQGGAQVALSYRKPELTRPKPANVDRLYRVVADASADVSIEEPTSERVTTATGRFLKEHVLTPGSLTLYLGSRLEGIDEDSATLVDAEGKRQTLPNQAVFSMIGREAPLEFFRRSGVRIRGEVKGVGWFVLFGVALAFAALYFWKNEVFMTSAQLWGFPHAVPEWFGVNDRTSLLGTLAISMRSPSFYYTLMYCVVMLTFGVRRVRRRRTPYVLWQTCSVLAVQFIPLFFLPEILLPWLGYNGVFHGGWLGRVADSLFPLQGGLTSDSIWPAWGHPRAYWKAYGFVLAWPLNVYNVFTATPQWGWLGVSVVQTFVIIPLMVWRWGKGAYCGWVCSCGGMAETLGDTHRHKMPHGPRWNRLNMLGQVVLAAAFALLILRVVGWVWSGGWADRVFPTLLDGKYASYKWIVDVFLGGVLGFGLYFHFSGRMWCRFACPLAALMHIYARFSQFRILAEKKKCISCNQCTSVCHQGIDIMNFANKGLPMSDPQCVRCSACVQSCPTGVLRFGRVGREGQVLGVARLSASRVHDAEQRPLPIASADS